MKVLTGFMVVLFGLSLQAKTLEFPVGENGNCDGPAIREAVLSEAVKENKAVIRKVIDLTEQGLNVKFGNPNLQNNLCRNLCSRIPNMGFWNNAVNATRPADSATTEAQVLDSGEIVPLTIVLQSEIFDVDYNTVKGTETTDRLGNVVKKATNTCSVEVPRFINSALVQNPKTGIIIFRLTDDDLKNLNVGN